ncbi:MAG: hypothetical protein ACMXYG_01865 [Candidatus Woesearchaeota archaeon]
MSKRKLVKQGNGALTVTLPFTWITQNSLTKGDYLNIRESGQDLVLSANDKLDLKEYEIILSENKPFFKRYVRSCYVLGYDRIVISSDKILPLKLIKESLLGLIGYEVIEQTSKKCIISVVAFPSDENFDTILKRIFFMVESMIIDIKNSLKENEFQLKEISEMESTINKFVDFCLRILNKKGYYNFHKTPYIYQVLNSLEICGDALRDFCLSFSDNNSNKKNNNVSNNLVQLISKIGNYYIGLRTLFYKYDMSLIEEIKKERIELLYQTKAYSDLYLMVQILHQLESALDPLNS